MTGLVQGLRQLGFAVSTKCQLGRNVTTLQCAPLQHFFSKSFSTSPIASKHHKILCRVLRPTWTDMGSNGRWEPQKKVRDLYDYTTDPILMPRNGGRGPNGRTYIYRKGGGFKKTYYMVDWVRGGPEEGEPLRERIMALQKCDHRSAMLALVCNGEKKRWVIASTNMKVGDFIQSTMNTNVPSLKAFNEGDALPISNLPQGALVFCIQREPNSDNRYACAGGATAQVVRHVGDATVVRLPSNQDIMIDSRSQCVLGKAMEDGVTNQKMYKAGQNRWLGIRPRSGLFHKKDGRYGRKIHGHKKVKDYIHSKPGVEPTKRRLFPDLDAS